MAKPDYDPHPFITDSLELILVLDRYITNNWGARCPDYEAGCVVCKMWELRDDMVEIINPEE